jgi:hypothetical protein
MTSGRAPPGDGGHGVTFRCRRILGWRCVTFLIDPPFVFCAGSLFAFLGRRRLIADSPNLFGASARSAVGFAAFFWLSVTWFALYAPDWMLSYLLPAAQAPIGFVHALFGVCLVVAALAGHTLTAAALQRGRTIGGLAVLGAGLFIWFGLWGLTLDRYFAYGTTAEWLAGTTIPIAKSPIATPMNVAGPVQAIAFFVPAIYLYQTSRRLRAG